MNTRNFGILGLAALGLVLTVRVQAAPNFMEESFIVAKRDQVEEPRQDQRDPRKEGNRASKSKDDRDESEGYGYGYERRQQQQRNENGSRTRGRQ
jgi:hypothetical protein